MIIFRQYANFDDAKGDNLRFLHGLPARVVLSALLIVLMLITIALALRDTGGITISDAWTRSTFANATGAAYMVIRNDGATSERLVSVSTDVAAAVELHEMAIENDVMRMRELESGLEIPPGETITLEPSGYHMMLIGITRDINPDETISLMLMFASGKEITLSVPVRAN